MSKHIGLLATATLMMGTAITSYSGTLTVDEARALAAEFMSSKKGKAPEAIRLNQVPTSESTSAPLYYVFNTADNAGFVIIAAEASATPVLGYSFDGSYPAAASLPEPMQWVMSGIEREIKAAPSMQTANTTAELRRMARSAGQRAAEKLLSTPSWSQEGPFNSMIPGQPLVGCVGTAMATVMKYHNFPESGSGSFGGVDFNVNYDWDSMRADNYRSGYTQTEGEAVATLMYHASKSIDTQYAKSGSSAYEVRVPGALSTYFGYDPGVSYKKRAEVATQQEWDDIVKDEIDAGRPVIYCGQDVTAGHAFVCDGYQGNYLHFNWGWGGSANGYFLSTALNPTVSRQHNYNNLNTIIYNIKPGSGAITSWSPIHITADGNQVGMGSDLTDLSSGKTFTVRVGNLKNLSYDDFSGKIAVALYGSNGAMKTLLSTPANFNMQSMAMLLNGYMDLSGCKLPAGATVADDDVVRIATQAAGSSEWLPVAGELPTINELAANGSFSKTFAITLPTGVTGVSISGDPSVIPGWNYSFQVTPENALENVVTVKANGYVLTPGNNYTYVINNVREDQNVTVLVQNAADVIAKRSIWVENPGTLSTLIAESETGTIKDLTLFGSIDARDFEFMRTSMQLNRVDLSGVYIAAYGTDQANAMPRNAFRGARTINEVIIPKSVNRFNNGCFFQCGISSITIPSGVKTYEYNVFVGDTNLRDIYVGRESAEFINWCVLSGVKVDLVTLHVPTERAVTNYRNAENWGTIANIIVDPIVESSTDVLFAVMDDADVKYESDILPGKMEKGASVSFAASLIPDNDNRMEVYANSTLLTPDANGIYTTTLNTNTIIHFNMVSPTKVESYKSAWTLTDKNGSVGLLTDAVNVLPGQDFTIRVNALNIPQYYDQLYWAAALTDAEGNIKEFISPVNLWTAGAGDGMKMNVTCCVKDSKVREGNTIRLVTSVNKRNWTVVTGAKSEITDAIPALNNQTEVYNIALNTQGNASVTGVPETAVRGRDITIKATPASAAHRMDLTIDGKLVAQGAASINHTFVVMADVDIDLKVFDPKQEGTVTYNVSPGELYKAVTAATVMPNVVVTGEVYGRDLSRAFSQDFAAKTIKKLDLSGVKIVANVISPTDKYDSFSDFIPSNMLYNPTSVNAVMPVVEEILLPDGVQTIAEGAFTNCANLKEIRLPSSLTTEKRVVGYFASGSERKGFAIDRKAFAGCTSLKKIYLPCAPGVVNGRQVVCFADPYGSYANGVNSGLTVFDGSTQLYDLGFWQDGKPNASDITLIVPAEYLSVYKTKYNDANYGNPWVAYNYNILSEDPVYGVNFDASRVAPVDPSTDITKLASFLGENVPLTSIKAENVLKLVKPEASCLVFDNGQPIQPTEDGLISVEFFNPAKDAAAAGNHNITVVYTCDLAFNTTSSLFTIAEPEVINDSEYKSGAFDRTDALAPVLKSVAENSTVRFRLDFHSEHDAALETHVMDGQQEIMADADGIYTVNIATAGKTIDIFAVPTNGATLNAEEIASLDPAQSAAITDIALTGEMSAEALAQAIECFPSLENLDLSDLEGELPDGAFQGMAALTSVTLPEVETITDNMFSGCSSLQNVDIPASVNSIGAGAFEGCSSLSSVSLTGVTEIGEGAFNGCDNLTTITLLADAAGSASHNAPARKPRRAAGITEDSFSGLNPNCFVILDEGVTIPVAGRNVLNTTTGMIDDIDADGNPTRREGRIYTAAASVNFNSANPLAIPYNFTLAEDASITLSVENEKWNSLVAPFDVEKITDEAGNEMEVTVYDPKARNAEGFYLYTLAEGAENLSSVASAKANTPYLFHAPESGVYHFSATGVAVSATPAAVGVEGKDYGLHATYAATEVPAADTYVLSEDAWAFIPVDTDDETVTIAPNTVYATSPVKVAEIPTLLPDAEQTTAIDDIEWDGTELTVAIYGKTLVVYSPEARTEIIYSTDGRAVKALALNAGRNDFHLDLNGIYIVAGTKVKI
ncbi:MAG: leucine-rich repeat protein [Bacteroidales bacterium]|nr:leucine-rich repeat protein [Bacteroidales bacterium]